MYSSILLEFNISNKQKIITRESVVKHSTMPTFVLFIMNTVDSIRNLFNLVSTVKFKFDTTAGVSFILSKYDTIKTVNTEIKIVTAQSLLKKSFEFLIG